MRRKAEDRRADAGVRSGGGPDVGRGMGFDETTRPAPDPRTNLRPTQAKREAVLRSVLAASAITLLKIITGVATGSLGMLSEAAHSGIDLLASVMTLFSLRVSDKPADDEHSYGHGRVESLSAFVETVFMLASSVWITVEAVRRIVRYRHGVPLEITVSPWPVLVLVLSIAVDWTRSRQLREVAQRSHSQALEAEAVHFGTDIWSSFAVLVGLGAAYLGSYFHINGLELADPIAAILVSAIILKVTVHLLRETIAALTDATPVATRRELVEAVRRIPGVVSVDRLRMRRSGPEYFADVTIGMSRNISFQRSEQIVSAATAAIQAVLPGTDVVVHTVPTAEAQESVFDRVRAVASRSDLEIHDVSVQQLEDGLLVEQHLELPADMPLREAHETATRIEAEMRREVAQIRSIVTHIESKEETIERPVRMERDRLLVHDLRELAAHFPEVEDIHDVTAMRHGDRLEMSCHCTMPDDLHMDHVHRTITALESVFLRKRPEVSRLLIHPEPATDNRR